MDVTEAQTIASKLLRKRVNVDDEVANDIVYDLGKRFAKVDPQTQADALRICAMVFKNISNALTVESYRITDSQEAA